jgi:hypothetical protein
MTIEPFLSPHVHHCRPTSAMRSRRSVRPGRGPRLRPLRDKTHTLYMPLIPFVERRVAILRPHPAAGNRRPTAAGRSSP